MSFFKNILNKQKQTPIVSYEDFWRWFLIHEKTFFKATKEHNNIESDFLDKLSPKLNELKEGFYFLVGMDSENVAELVITVDGTIENIIFAEELINSAPKIEGWKFTALKPEIDITNVSISMAGYSFNCGNMSFYATDHHDCPDLIDITVVHKDATEENESEIAKGVHIFLDNYLGELNYATTIDNLQIISPPDAPGNLIPIEKLKNFLIWREKEFIEKYEGIRHNTESDSYAGLEAELESGKPMLAVVNTDLLNWDGKASHPWILHIEIQYNGEESRGLPDEKDYKTLDDIEDGIIQELKDSEGYLNIGRETADGVRDIYFACRDFRKPSKLLYQIQNEYADIFPLTYYIYKDKYWQSFNRFISS
ncbi:DUF695 domain-containing protein [Hymenobacter sp. 5516J-16]|uniref:DUF695 domain-containing protein n=1 Tax=Hymenobacter sp. 5516J-16 TaxID=2932253 RepID=UPI001FD36716|nr:DUF695 domain-containing protein [Hymenobacter sp. 5516J-16]UOQ77587.1 DUF695 domain-containing protein [Hymenobacter sp. 5516J-16]